MPKIVIDEIASGYSLSKINDQFNKIESYINDKVLSRDSDGNSNAMSEPLDMNSNAILNLPTPDSPTSPVRVVDVPALAAQAQGANYIGETAPTAVFQGMRWFNPAVPTTYVWYQDSDSGQWVEETAQGVDGKLRQDLGAVDSTVPIAGVPAKFIVSTFVTPEMYGAVGDGIADDTEALYLAHLSGKNVLSKAGVTYLVKKSNYIPLIDGRWYDYSLSKINISADCTVADAVGIAGRYNNGLFSVPTPENITSGILVKNLSIYSAVLKVNGIYLADTRGGSYTHTAPVIIENVFFETVGESAGRGGGVDCEAGGLLLGHGYIVKVINCEAKYCGQGIMALGSKLAYIDNFRSVYCGVSRDFTTTANGSSILVRSSEVIHIVNSYSYVTGGSSYFVSQDGSEPTKHVYVVGNTLIGCGFSAISAGARSYTPVAASIESIIIKDNVVRGFCCGINADLHSGIKVSLESAFASTIKSVEVSGTVDYLAPWEAFSDVNGDVTGSYNVKKTKGNDVGSQFGVTIIMGTADYCESAKVNVQVLNHQRGGLAVEKVENATVDCFAYNCGWSKTGANAPFQIQQPVYVTKCTKADVKAIVEKTCFLVTQNQNWCSPVYLSDNVNIALDVTTRNTGSQLYGVRIQNTVDGCATTIKALYLDKFVLDAGFRYYLDLSAGSFSKSHKITSKLGVANVSFITGSRTLPPLTEIVKSDFPARTVTLEKAVLYSGSVIEFATSSAGGSGAMTINAAAGDNIDGAGSYVLASQAKVRLYSDPFTANLWRVLA